VLVGTVVILQLFFLRTRLGLALRTAADNPSSARLLGLPVGSLLLVGWGLAALLRRLAGCLVAPSVPLQPNMMDTILVYALAAAVLGGLDSPLGAVVAAWLIGIVETVAGANIDVIGFRPAHRGAARAAGADPAGAAPGPVRPPGRGAAVTTTERASAAPATLSARARPLRWVAYAVVAVVLLAIPQFASPYTNLQLTLILVYGVAILGWTCWSAGRGRSRWGRARSSASVRTQRRTRSGTAGGRWPRWRWRSRWPAWSRCWSRSRPCGCAASRSASSRWRCPRSRCRWPTGWST
jgi:hypothetical protein